MIQLGETIPQEMEFDIFQDDNTKKTSFADYKGKWLVLLFYPKDFTFVCPTELEAAAEKYDEFKKEGAEIISFSADTVFVHKAWHDNSEAIAKIKYPMGADPTGKVCRAFGTYIEEEGFPNRASIIIDPDGAVVAIDTHADGIGRSIDEVFRKLQAAKFVRENPGDVCPASWKPGEKTLKPGMDLVGKI